MRIKKINEKKLKGGDFFEYFSNPNIKCDELFSEEYYEVENISFFPIYIAEGRDEEKKKQFLEGFNTIKLNYLILGKEILLDKIFWYSLFFTKDYRNYIIENYPQTLKSEKKFKNIVLKKFDWENYVYKLVLGADYISEEVVNEEHHDKYFNLIFNNLDVYNYLLKSELFRNGKFMKNILDVIDKNNISSDLKKRILDIEKPNVDKRVGREIIASLSQSYPTLFIHDLDYDDFEILFMKFYKQYNNF